MAYKINSQSFELQECCSCGVNFLLPVILGCSLRRNKNVFYCPNGHGQSYKESEADRLKKQLAITQASLNETRIELNSLKTPPRRKAKRITKLL